MASALWRTDTWGVCQASRADGPLGDHVATRNKRLKPWG
jgi:hypothetical protein